MTIKQRVNASSPGDTSPFGLPSHSRSGAGHMTPRALFAGDCLMPLRQAERLLASPTDDSVAMAQQRLQHHAPVAGAGVLAKLAQRPPGPREQRSAAEQQRWTEVVTEAGQLLAAATARPPSTRRVPA